MPNAARSLSRGCTKQSHDQGLSTVAAPEMPPIEAIRDLLDGLTPTEWRNVRATIRAFELGLLEERGQP